MKKWITLEPAVHVTIGSVAEPLTLSKHSIYDGRYRNVVSVNDVVRCLYGKSYKTGTLSATIEIDAQDSEMMEQAVLQCARAVGREAKSPMVGVYKEEGGPRRLDYLYVKFPFAMVDAHGKPLFAKVGRPVYNPALHLTTTEVIDRDGSVCNKTSAFSYVLGPARGVYDVKVYARCCPVEGKYTITAEVTRIRIVPWPAAVAIRKPIAKRPAAPLEADDTYYDVEPAEADVPDYADVVPELDGGVQFHVTEGFLRRLAQLEWAYATVFPNDPVPAFNTIIGQEIEDLRAVGREEEAEYILNHFRNGLDVCGWRPWMAGGAPVCVASRNDAADTINN